MKCLQGRHEKKNFRIYIPLGEQVECLVVAETIRKKR